MAGTMTPYERLEAFLRVFTYKPGWELRAERSWTEGLPYGGREEEIFLWIQFETPDVNHPERTIPVGKRCRLPYSLAFESGILGPDVMLAEWVVHMIKDIEIHEADEWARLDGVPIHDPHPKPKLVPPLPDGKLAM